MEVNKPGSPPANAKSRDLGKDLAYGRGTTPLDVRPINDHDIARPVGHTPHPLHFVGKVRPGKHVRACFLRDHAFIPFWPDSLARARRERDFILWSPTCLGTIIGSLADCQGESVDAQQNDRNY